MTTRLGSEETRFVVNDTTITLRPTLRAAMRLERLHGGFDKLMAGILQGSVTVASDIFKESAGYSGPLPCEHEGLGVAMASLASPLSHHIVALAGIDADAPATKEERRAAVKPITFEERHRQLFGLATGWLGWPPETAWNATPAEIMAAYAGHIDMLKVTHGVQTQDDNKPKGSLSDKFKAVFARHNIIRAQA